MKGLYFKREDIPLDDIQAISSVFMDIDATVIFVDMTGCLSASMNFFDQRPRVKGRVASVGLGELPYVMGDDAAFLEEFERLYREDPSELVVLSDSPISNVVGLDVAPMAEVLEARIGVPVLYVPCTGNDSFKKGLEASFDAIYKRFCAGGERAERVENSVNVLGLDRASFKTLAEQQSVIARVEAQGYEVLSVWGVGDEMGRWPACNSAALNIVVGDSGLKLAKKMQRSGGIPFIELAL